MRSFLAMRCMSNKFPRESEKYIFEAWEDFLRAEMPLVPGVDPPQPSDDVYDFVVAKGSDFHPPLGKYLYGENPLGFGFLREGQRPMTNTTCEPSTLDTAFTGQFAGKEVLCRSSSPDRSTLTPFFAFAHPTRLGSTTTSNASSHMSCRPSPTPGCRALICRGISSLQRCCKASSSRQR